MQIEIMITFNITTMKYHLVIAVVLGTADSPECGESLYTLKQIFRELLAEEKQNGPTCMSVITF